MRVVANVVWRALHKTSSRVQGRLHFPGVVFRLNGGRVDAMLMQDSTDIVRDEHIIGRTFDVHMYRCDDLGLGQLPDMQLMDGAHTIDLSDGFANIIQRHMCRYALKENDGRRPDEREGGREDDDGNDKTDCGVKVIAPVALGYEDDKARQNDTNVAQGIAEHVQDQGAHVHRAVRMAVSMTVTMRAPFVAMTAVLGLRWDCGVRRRGLCVFWSGSTGRGGLDERAIFCAKRSV